MKALAIDSASPCLTIMAENNDISSTIILDIGMHQSEKILPAIEQVLKDVNLPVNEIEFGSLCLGPGTFTGLRLSFAALKGIHATYNFPIYAFDSLKVYANPFLELKKPVLSVLDAKKKRFYVSLFRESKVSVESFDAEPIDVKKILDNEEEVILTGPDADYFSEIYETIDPNQKFIIIGSKNTNTAYQLLKLGKKAFESGAESLKEFEGPVYIRPSEAEEAKITASK